VIAVLVPAGWIVLPSPPTAAPVTLGGSFPAGTLPAVQIVPLSAAHGFPIAGTAAEPEATATSAHATAIAGLYNLASGTGGVFLNATPSGAGITTSVALGSIATKRDGVVGYPNLRYGYDPFCGCGPATATSAESPGLPLPATVGGFRSWWASVAFAAAPGGTTGATYDIAFDLWLTHDRYAAGADPGDVEIMVWLYLSDPSILPPSALGAVPTGPSLPGFTASTWQATGGWTTVYFFAASDRLPVQSTSIDLNAILHEAAIILGEGGVGGGSTWESLYVEGIDLGSEFLAGPAGAPVRYDWTLSAYQLSADRTDGT